MFFNYMLRINMSINILAMVQHTDTNGSAVQEPDVGLTIILSSHQNCFFLCKYGPRYAWSPYEQSMMLGSFFWGNAITSIPFGIVCQKYGGKNVITYLFTVCVILTALTPVLAQISFWISCVNRFFIGFASVNNLLICNFKYAEGILNWNIFRAVCFRHCIIWCPCGLRPTRRANSRQPCWEVRLEL